MTAHSTLSLPPAAPLPAAQLAIIKATVPVLQQHGEAITREMYATLIAAHPGLRAMFSHTSQTTGAQPRALARAVLAYATYVEDLPKLQHAVERIAQKHASLYVRPEQYDVVGVYLLKAIETVLGSDVATADVLAAWGAAYGILVSVFVGREGTLYREEVAAGWTTGKEGITNDGDGWREFRIEKKVVEAEGVVSFWLVPSEGGKLPSFLPGQYVSVRVDVPALGHAQCRQFSLSSAPGEAYYRVTVKREDKTPLGGDGTTSGLVSNLLHDEYREGDTVHVSYPRGEFFLDVEQETGNPLVLVSAGVGATPLVSILKALEKKGNNNKTRSVSWIHTSRSRATQPFRDEVAAAAAGLQAVAHVHLTGEQGGKRLDLKGLSGQESRLLEQDPRTEYFVCGPEAFMVQVRRTLVDELGVAAERVRLELFATGDVVVE